MVKSTQFVRLDRARGVFFDLYGTLLIYGNMNQAWSDWLDCVLTNLRDIGLEMSRRDFANRCQGFFSWPDPDENLSLTLYERRIYDFAKQLGVAMNLDQAQEAARKSVQAWQSHIKLDKEAPGVLSKLKDRVEVALITNFDHPPHVRSVLKETGLSQFFRTIIISADAGCRKPDPRIFDQALKSNNLLPQEVIYVGDSSEDVKGAIAAGITPILICRPVPPGTTSGHNFRSDRDKPMPGSEIVVPDGTVVVSSLAELIL